MEHYIDKDLAAKHPFPVNEIREIRIKVEKHEGEMNPHIQKKTERVIEYAQMHAISLDDAFAYIYSDRISFTNTKWPYNWPY